MTSLLLLSSLLLQTAPAADDAIEKEQKRLEGTWVLVSAEEHGKTVPEKDLKDGFGQMKWVFKGDKLTLVDGKEKPEGSYKLDPTKKPRELDLPILGGKDGKLILCIYELDGDTLKIGLGSKDGGKRLKEFKTSPDTEGGIMVLKREK